MAEALLNRAGRGRVVAESAGARPADRVSRFAVTALAEVGIDWLGHTPRGLDGLDREQWDAVVTVCDKAKESCPIFPGQPLVLHWSLHDPAEATGSDAERLAVFRASRDDIARRIDALLARLT
jgi:arsenate reductase (thioredoxin)